MRIIAYNTDSSHNIQTLIYFNIVTSWLHAKSQGIRIRMKLLHDVLKLLVVSDPLWCTWFMRFSEVLVSFTSVSACSAFKASRNFHSLGFEQSSMITWNGTHGANPQQCCKNEEEVPSRTRACSTYHGWRQVVWQRSQFMCFQNRKRRTPCL